MVVRNTRLMTPKQLCAVLRDAANTIEKNNSGSGAIAYTRLVGIEHKPIPEGWYEVMADYRVGNEIMSTKHPEGEK